MATLSEYFETEAREFMAQLHSGLARAPMPDAGELHRAVRGLRGTAQMAREDRVFRAISAFESVTRALASNALAWSEDVARRAQETLGDLHALVERSEDESSLDARVDASIGRWADAGVAAQPRSALATGEGQSGSREFREYAAREVAGIADAFDKGVQQLAAAPMDREPLKMILRRQRALLGAARLDEIPVVAEILRAIEDLTRVIAKLDVGVKQEWLDIYRVAREGLKGTIEPLERDEDPPASHALSRLRHMREELLERYGTGEAVSAAHESGGLVQATKMDQPPAPVTLPAEPAATAFDAAESAAASVDAVGTSAAGDVLELVDESEPHDEEDDGPDLIAAAANALQRASANVTGAVAAAAGAVARAAATPPEPQPVASADDVVPIEDLLYRGDAALARAFELRDTITRAVAHDVHTRDAVEELFDLIRLARG